MTREEQELSRKLLNAQAEILALRKNQDDLIMAVAGIINAVRRHETVIEAMMIARKGHEDHLQDRDQDGE